MIILAWFGGIVVAAVAGAAIYDRRTRRRGRSPGPSEGLQHRLEIDHTGSSYDAAIATLQDGARRESGPGPRR